MSDTYPGLYQGIVINNVDPQARGRVILQVPQVLGDAASNWCEPTLPTVYTPRVGEIVYVQFINGDPIKPVYQSADEVTAEKIVAGTITAAQIAAGSITGEEIASNTISTENLTLVANADLIPNGSFDEVDSGTSLPTYWNRTDPAGAAVVSMDPNVSDRHSVASGGYSVKIDNYTDWAANPYRTGALWSEVVAVVPGQWVKFSWWAACDNATSLLYPSNPNNWSSTTTYSPYAQVTGSDGNTYQAVAGSTDVDPTTDTTGTYWTPYVNSVGQWSSTTAYDAGDMVYLVNTSTTYIAVVPNYGQRPNYDQGQHWQIVYDTQQGQYARAVFHPSAPEDISDLNPETSGAQVWDALSGVPVDQDSTTYGFSSIASAAGGSWASDVTYGQGARVFYGGNTYVSFLSTLLNVTPDTQFQDMDSWDPTVTYTAEDYVIGSDGNIYRALTTSANEDPTLTSGYWTAISSTWFLTGIYAADSIVQGSDSNFYASIMADNQGIDPTTDYDQTYWYQIMSPWILTEAGAGWTKYSTSIQVPQDCHSMMVAFGEDGTDVGGYNIFYDDAQIALLSSADILSSDYVPGQSGWALFDNDQGISQLENLNVLFGLGATTASVDFLNQSVPTAPNSVDSQGNQVYDSNGNQILPGIQGDFAAVNIMAVTNKLVVGGQDWVAGSDGAMDVADYVIGQLPALSQAIASSKYGSSSVNSKAATPTNSPFMIASIDCGPVQNGHVYLIGYSISKIENGTAGDNIYTYLTYTIDGSAVNSNSTTMNGTTCCNTWPSQGGGPMTAQMVTTYNPGGNYSALKLGLIFQVFAGTGGEQAIFTQPPSAINMWCLDMGTSSQVTMAQYNKSSGSDDSAPPAPTPPPPAPTPTTKRFSAAWTATYKGNLDKRTDNVQYMYQGYYSPYNGNMRSAGGWASTGLANLGSKTIKSMGLHFKVAHTYYNAGADFKIGTHNATGSSAPNSWSGKTINNFATVKSANAGSWYAVAIPKSLWSGLSNGSIGGISIGPASTSLQDYGFIYGRGSGSDPFITVTYE